MARITEKIFFKGTPAQFCAVVAEYDLDVLAAGGQFSFQITDPQTEVVVQPVSRHPTDELGRLIDMVRTSFTHREYVVALRPDSPRATIICYIGKENFFISSLMCPSNRTQLTLRTESEKLEDIRDSWLSIVGYMNNLGWLEESEPVKQARLPEPETWVAQLEKMDIAKGSIEWWSKIEKWTRSYWERKGKNALPISGKSPVTLEKITGYVRKTIYDKTTLGEKRLHKVTQSDNFGYISVVYTRPNACYDIKQEVMKHDKNLCPDN